MSPRRQPEQVELTAADPRAAIDAFASLVTADAGGWVNLLPEVDEQDVQAVTPSVVGSLFRAAGPPIPQATLIAPTSGRRPKPAQVGITHGVGTRVVPRLRAEGLALPAGWAVVQDHVRRGLVLRIDDGLDAGDAVTWALRAAALLCPVPLTGRWLCEVHAP